VETHQREGYQVEREGGVAVAISTVLTPELQSEGLARELVHHIQNTRKAADFEIDDRIHLWVSGPAEIAEMLAVHGNWVKKETLAVSLEVSVGDRAAAAADGAEEAAVARAGAPAGDAVPDAAVTQADAYREELKVNGLPVTVEVARA